MDERAVVAFWEAKPVGVRTRLRVQTVQITLPAAHEPRHHVFLYDLLSGNADRSSVEAVGRRSYFNRSLDLRRSEIAHCPFVESSSVMDIPAMKSVETAIVVATKDRPEILTGDSSIHPADRRRPAAHVYVSVSSLKDAPSSSLCGRNNRARRITRGKRAAEHRNSPGASRCEVHRLFR